MRLINLLLVGLFAVFTAPAAVADEYPEWMTSDGASVPTGRGILRWTEWQVNLDLSYKIELFTPYIGTK